MTMKCFSNFNKSFFFIIVLAAVDIARAAVAVVVAAVFFAVAVVAVVVSLPFRFFEVPQDLRSKRGHFLIF